MGNIKDNILQMKNLSEIMTEMAYSALFLRDMDIAVEVGGMFKRIETLEDETLRLIFKIKDSEEERIVIMDMIDYIKDLANTARDMAALVHRRKFPTIVQAILSESDSRVITEIISKNSILANKTVGESKIRVHARGARIVCLKRDNAWLFSVSKETLLLPGDFIVAVGPSHGEILKDVAAGKAKSWQAAQA